MRTRFWVELTLAGASGILLAVTILWSDWIEAVFGVDPDHGSSALEYGIVAATAGAAATSSLLAALEWHRVRTAKA
jgi:hypothetical protein